MSDNQDDVAQVRPAKLPHESEAALKHAKELLIGFIQESYLQQTTGKSEIDRLIRKAREFLNVEA